MLDNKKYYINNKISEARTLHSDYYTSDKIFSNSIKQIFSNSWQLVSHKNDLEKLNIIPFRFLEDSISEPLILTKENDEIHCISNVCTHRGHLICNNKKLGKSFTCRYHGRSFHLDGQFKNAVGFDGVKDFPSQNDNLNQLKIKEWNDFIFVSFTNKIDISNLLLDIDDRLEQFPFSKLIYSENLSSTYTINAHWALYCENYLEGFHVPFVHKGLSREIDNSSYTTLLLDGGVLQYADNNNPPHKVYGYYYWIFPNLMLNFYDWGLSINIVEPISKNKTRIRFLSYLINDNTFTREAIDDLKTIELEDQSVVSSVQKGIQSMCYSNGRYSPENEKGVHYLHTLLSKFI